MAAAIKALNAKIRSNKYADYFCSTRKSLRAWSKLRSEDVPVTAVRCTQLEE